MPSDAVDYYRVLGLASNASDEDIKRGYKKLAVKYHPDKTSDKNHHELFIKIQEAYETLKDPEKRRKYDTENGKSKYSSYTASATASKAGRMPGYYGFYQQFYRTYQHPDMAERQKSAQEEKLRRDRETQAARAAKAAKEKIDEQLQREREIRLQREREAKIQKEREAKIQRERERERHNEKQSTRADNNGTYTERKKDAYRKEWENTFAHFAKEDEVDQYFYERRKTQERAKDNSVFPEYTNPPNSSSHEQQTPDTEHLGKHGHDSNDPIVLDDEEDEVSAQRDNKSNDATSSAGTSTRSSNGAISHQDSDSDSDSDNDEFVSVLHESSDGVADDAVGDTAHSNWKGVEQLFNAQMNLRPRQEPVRLSKSRRSTSPTRNKPVAPSTSYVRNDSTLNEQPASKRPKTKPTFGFDDLKGQLGVDIGNVDFTEVLESLPKEPSNEKTRKVSDDLSSRLKTKRPRVAEYTNGSSKAETLHIPINKNSVKGHSVPSGRPKKTLTMLDLHASPAIHDFSPPTPPHPLLDNKLTHNTWMKYVASIRKYQSDFLNYKRHIVQYQLERSKKDDEYFELINSSSSSFIVYQQCLERDYKVLQQFTELLRVFGSTMDTYKQNCNWVKMSNI